MNLYAESLEHACVRGISTAGLGAHRLGVVRRKTTLDTIASQTKAGIGTNPSLHALCL